MFMTITPVSVRIAFDLYLVALSCVFHGLFDLDYLCPLQTLDSNEAIAINLGDLCAVSIKTTFHTDSLHSI